MVDTNKLKKISTYASMIKKSRSWVNKLIEKGDVKTHIIDGVIFVVID